MAEQSRTADHDDQDVAEMYDEEARGGDEAESESHHQELLAPDLGGVDDVAELVATFDDAEGPIGPEDAALHLEDDRP
jgi:hypothetical protein